MGRRSALSYSAYAERILVLEADTSTDPKVITFPLGIAPDGSVMPGTAQYSKSDLIAQYRSLSEYHLALNGVYQLVSYTEILFGILLFEVVRVYPRKLGGKRNISLALLFEKPTLEDVQESAINSLRNELAYLSPKEYAEAIQPLLGVNLLEIPAYHKYIEIKATRDVYIHDRGIANLVYKGKAASHSRAKPGQQLPMNVNYFLQSYESCHCLSEDLRREFHSVWQSDLFLEELQIANMGSKQADAANGLPPVAQP